MFWACPGQVSMKLGLIYLLEHDSTSHSAGSSSPQTSFVGRPHLLHIPKQRRAVLLLPSSVSSGLSPLSSRTSHEFASRQSREQYRVRPSAPRRFFTLSPQKRISTTWLFLGSTSASLQGLIQATRSSRAVRSPGGIIQPLAEAYRPASALPENEPHPPGCAASIEPKLRKSGLDFASSPVCHQ